MSSLTVCSQLKLSQATLPGSELKHRQSRVVSEEEWEGGGRGWGGIRERNENSHKGPEKLKKKKKEKSCSYQWGKCINYRSKNCAVHKD